MTDSHAPVRVVLGPTNTGKTHLAMARCLAHASGIIGFPLRLLARENYERMVAAKGAAHVALVTGEERIEPPGARWYSCTVEAMPLDRHAAFLAVDEIQLAADPDRGHVFTDRLLRARGRAETMFLGAATIRPLLARLVPEAEFETRPRLSTLVHAGSEKLARLPPRSAIVAFSAAEVYAIAEAIRRRRGGCAVVMGRLSPRTRNAQVALYQEREVDFLVATDAIGMGLNMDVDHVAFAGLSKFDGRSPRPLAPAELAQIAGRAGRGMRDGSFGTTGLCPALDDAVAAAIEAHTFAPLAALSWRNAALDFTDVDALLASLNAPPSAPGLVRGAEASDVATLAALAREPEVRARARGRARVGLLWQACQIPDFRKLADDSHARLAARVFSHLSAGRRLPSEWIGAQIARLDVGEGDIDTLMGRLSGIRVFAYIAARPGWLEAAEDWQERARAVEDRLSDALHARLMSRFVDRRAAHLIRRLDGPERHRLLSAVTAAGAVVVEGHQVGRMAGFAFLPEEGAVGEGLRLALRAARRALAQEIPRRLARLEAAADEEFSLGPDLALSWRGVAIAHLARGVSALAPRVEVVASEFLDGAGRERVRLRLARFVAVRMEVDFGSLLAARDAAAAFPALRGPLHRLVEGLGVVPAEELPPLGDAERRVLSRLGLCAGRFALVMPSLLRTPLRGMRAALWALACGFAPLRLPPPSRVAVAPPGNWPAGAALALGYLAAGPVLLRLDVAERVAAELAGLTRAGARPLPAGLAARLGARGADLPAVLSGLGFRLQPAASLAAGVFGPPVPAMLRARRPTPAPAEVAPAFASPFAALARLALSA